MREHSSRVRTRAEQRSNAGGSRSTERPCQRARAARVRAGESGVEGSSVAAVVAPQFISWWLRLSLKCFRSLFELLNMVISFEIFYLQVI